MIDTIIRLATRQWSYCPVGLRELVTRNKTAMLALQYGASMETIYKIVPSQPWVRLETWTLVDSTPLPNRVVDSILRNHPGTPVYQVQTIYGAWMDVERLEPHRGAVTRTLYSRQEDQ